MNVFSKLLSFACFVCLFFMCFLDRAVGTEDEQTGFSWQTDEQAISLFDRSELVFKFNYAFRDHYNVPQNEPRKFAGDYVYPLMGVLGENLTDDAPKDHYHHHGMFWTWPGVFIHQKDGTVKQYDLWTSNTNIRQRFNNLELLEASAQRAVIRVENGWYVDGNSTTPDIKLDASKTGFAISDNESLYGEKVVTEIIQLTVFPIEEVEGLKTRSIDLELTLIPLNHDVSLQGAEKKSYGGLTIRFRPKGKIGVDEFITTDEGVAKEDMPEKNLRWADYTSRFLEKKSGDVQDELPLSGAAIFLAPDFPDYPPTWLTRYYGPLCVGFPGVDAQRFEAGKPIVMKARIWIHEGLASTELLKKVYENYITTQF